MESAPKPVDQLLRAVGASLSNWSLVELQLASLFSIISDMKDQSKATSLFDTIINFETRLALCDHLMARDGADAVEAEMWAKLSGKLSKFYKKRHELAHFTLLSEDIENPAISPFLTASKIFHASRKQLSLAQIKERSEKFIDLSRGVGWFCVRAFLRRGIVPEDLQPNLEEPPLVPQLRALAIQSLEASKPQPQSERG